VSGCVHKCAASGVVGGVHWPLVQPFWIAHAPTATASAAPTLICLFCVPYSLLQPVVYEEIADHGADYVQRLMKFLLLPAEADGLLPPSSPSSSSASSSASSASSSFAAAATPVSLEQRFDEVLVLTVRTSWQAVPVKTLVVSVLFGAAAAAVAAAGWWWRHDSGHTPVVARCFFGDSAALC
jgi:hypothetical protein